MLSTQMLLEKAWKNMKKKSVLKVSHVYTTHHHQQQKNCMFETNRHFLRKTQNFGQQQRIPFWLLSSHYLSVGQQKMEQLEIKVHESIVIWSVPHGVPPTNPDTPAQVQCVISFAKHSVSSYCRSSKIKEQKRDQLSTQCLIFRMTFCAVAVVWVFCIWDALVTRNRRLVSRVGFTPTRQTKSQAAKAVQDKLFNRSHIKYKLLSDCKMEKKSFWENDSPNREKFLPTCMSYSQKRMAFGLWLSTHQLLSLFGNLCLGASLMDVDTENQIFRL